MGISFLALVPLGFGLADTLYRQKDIFSSKEQTTLWLNRSLGVLVLAWCLQCLDWCQLQELAWLLVSPVFFVLLVTLVMGLAKYFGLL